MKDKCVTPVSDWYASSYYQIEELQLSNGSVLLSAQVQQLVDAMSGFNPPPLGQMELSASEHEALGLVIAASWQTAA